MPSLLLWCSKVQQQAWQRSIDELIDNRRKYADKLQVLHACLVQLQDTCTTKEGVFRCVLQRPHNLLHT